MLLKERLRIEHWALVIKDAGKTNRQSFEKGKFESVTQNETLRRLADVVGIEVRAADKKALTDLSDARNALQHWGLTESALAVEARAAKVLDFLIRFLDDELLGELDEDQLDDIGRNMLHVREGLNDIKAYVKSRTDRLRGELRDVADHTVTCPSCTQLSLVVDNEGNKCQRHEFSVGQAFHVMSPAEAACPQPGDDTQVGGFVYLGVSLSPPKTDIEIPPSGLVDAHLAAQLAGVRVGTIRVWKHRGRLEVARDVDGTVFRDERGHELYDYMAVIQAEYATRERARRRVPYLA